MKSYILKHFIGTFIFFAFIFIAAGTLNYRQGLMYVAIGLAMAVLNYTVLKPDTSLLDERSKPGEGAKDWDKALLGLSFLCTLAMYVVAGLDSGRFHWSPEFNAMAYASGIALTIAGQLLFLVAQKQNRFFSSTVRIQKDRDHAVCDTGLYKTIRHPAYLGSILQLSGFPLIFGSLWSIIPAGMLIILHVTRTRLEDETLQKELAGYSEYALKTRYRIIPFVW